MIEFADAFVTWFVFTADRAGLQQKDVLEVLELTNMSSEMLLQKGNGKLSACILQRSSNLTVRFFP